jgi:predicted membrane-bound spermidine synthase
MNENTPPSGQAANHTPGRNIYFFLFAVSGFAGLIYESIWTHYLKLFLGHAAYAQTLVLIIFMGGMAVGAWGISRYTHKIRNLLLGYALVEFIIGVLGFLFHPAFVNITGFAYSSMIPGLDSLLMINGVKWGLAALFIFPQSVLLGATFPLMTAGVLRRFPGKPGRSLAILYFTNSLGGAAGILVSGFLLVGTLGLPGTIMTAGALNIILALIIAAISKNKSFSGGPGGRLSKGAAPPASEPLLASSKVKGDGKPRSFYKLFQSISKSSPLVAEGNKKDKPIDRLFIAFLSVAALTGTASFLYEIGWIRMLSLVLGSSTHAFELMLSAFILGLALGGYFIRKKIDQATNLARTLGIVQLTMGGLALATLLAYDQTFNLMSWAVKTLPQTSQGYFLFNLFSHGLSMLIMLPATICAGMTLPLITYFLLKKGYGESSIGRVYGANTIGAIIGVILAVHIVMPILGLKTVITMGGVIDIIVGLLLLRYVKPVLNIRRWAVTAAAFIVVILIAVFAIRFDSYKMASGVFHLGDISGKNMEILFHKDGKTSSVDVVKYIYNSSKKREGIAISTNGVCIGNLSADPLSIISEDNQILLAALPMSLYPGQIRNAATFGMGTGLTAYTLLTDPGLETLDVIEIEAAITEGATYYGEMVETVYNDPRCRIHIDDARAFFSSRNKTYDTIIADPTYPWVSGVSGLFSREFYRFIHRHLTGRGLFVQWLHLYHIDIKLVASVIKAVSENFSDYALYFTNDNYIAIIASKDTIARQVDGKVFDIPGLRDLLARSGIYKRCDLRLHKLGGKKMLDPLFHSYEIRPNSDFFPVLDLGAVKARFMKSDARELMELRTIALPLIEVLEGDPSPGRSLYSAKSIHSIARDAAQAAAVYQYFRSLESPGYFPSISMDEKTAEIVRNIRAMHNRTRFNENLWYSSLVKLMRLTLPYLSSIEMNIIWADIDRAGITGNWIDLYKAWSDRNFERIARLSATMFPDTAIEATPTNDYLLASTMLAFIALDMHEAAAELWNRYTNKENPSLVLRLLSRLAASVGPHAGGVR